MYGRGSKAIALAAREEGIEITEEEAQAIIDAIFQLYPNLVSFFAECRARAATQPGSRHAAPRWICGSKGRFRRFPRIEGSDSNARKLKGDIERQAQNFPEQNLVADVVSDAIAQIYYDRERNGLDYRCCLQIHDALQFLVRYDHVPQFIDDVLPRCMVRGVPIYPCALDGSPLGTGPFFLGIDCSTQFHWGITPTPDKLLQAGIPFKYAHWKESKGNVGGVEVHGLVNHEKYPGKIWLNNQLEALDAKKK